MKILLTILLILPSYISFADEEIDIIIVKKSERKLYAIKDDKILRKYDIALGQNPIGHKKFEGDKKTPEGYYFIDGKNAKSKYFLSLHISYPNYHDEQVALKKKKIQENISLYMDFHQLNCCHNIYTMDQIGQKAA